MEVFMGPLFPLSFRKGILTNPTTSQWWITNPTLPWRNPDHSWNSSLKGNPFKGILITSFIFRRNSDESRMNLQMIPDQSCSTLKEFWWQRRMNICPILLVLSYPLSQAFWPNITLEGLQTNETDDDNIWRISLRSFPFSQTFSTTPTYAGQFHYYSTDQICLRRNSDTFHLLLKDFWPISLEFWAILPRSYVQSCPLWKKALIIISNKSLIFHQQLLMKVLHLLA